jgi:hypothetical protein
MNQEERVYVSYRDMRLRDIVPETDIYIEYHGDHSIYHAFRNGEIIIDNPAFSSLRTIESRHPEKLLKGVIQRAEGGNIKEIIVCNNFLYERGQNFVSGVIRVLTPKKRDTSCLPLADDFVPLDLRFSEE